MFGPKELDIKNTYNPDLQNIQESAERTYGEANSFYRKEELYIKDIERRIKNGELTSEKDIYDECHAIASDLAKCCEMYLKALFIFEHNISGNQIDSLWNVLKNSEYKTDENGQLIYMTPSGVITYVKYDSNNEPIKDGNGKTLYFDNNGNVYNDNNKGSKIKRNGHQLDRLIELLSPESRLLLESRMLTIPMNSTENNSSVSVLDVLLEKGVLTTEQHISTEQYHGWIEQHKKTFEEARYSGQKQYSVNVEFLYHLATQIKAVVQFKIDPQKNQNFTVTEEELAKLPQEIKQLASFHSQLMSEDLIKLIANNDEVKNKIKLLFSGQYVLPSNNVSPLEFYKMIQLMDSKEIIFTSYLSYIIDNYDQFNKGKTINIAEIFKSLGMSASSTVGFLIQLKEMFGKSVTLNNESLEKIFKILRNKVAHGIYKHDMPNIKYNYYDEEKYKDIYNINKNDKYY